MTPLHQEISGSVLRNVANGARLRKQGPSSGKASWFLNKSSVRFAVNSFELFVWSVRSDDAKRSPLNRNAIADLLGFDAPDYDSAVN